MSREKHERKTALTFEEKITAAHLHYVQGVDQHVIAFAMGGVNPGRVNEACVTIREALEPRRVVDLEPSRHFTIDRTLPDGIIEAS
jgi:hypothetical protein